MSSQNVSQTLTDAGAKGTFFFNGNNCDSLALSFLSLLDSMAGAGIYSPANVDGVKFAYSQGHQVRSPSSNFLGRRNFSITHPDSVPYLVAQ